MTHIKKAMIAAVRPAIPARAKDWPIRLTKAERRAGPNARVVIANTMNTIGSDIPDSEPMLTPIIKMKQSI